ncbi:MAG: AAA family ATPase [Alphaproteobacteria bacterium]|nr:AAA family ATPase [Alphaproteobacteria bacterium]
MPERVDDPPLDLSRVVVVGTSCSGKTTFARALARRLGAEHIELDALNWLPNWVERQPSELLALVVEKASGTAWVSDGNYDVTQDLLWSRATAVVWLDYSFPLVLWRSVKRTVARVITGDPVCGDNCESWRIAFFSKRSIILWVIKSYPERQRRYGALFAGGSYPNATKIRLKTPAEAARVLARVTPT